MCACVCVRECACTCMCVRTCVCVCEKMHANACTLARAQAWARAHTHANSFSLARFFSCNTRTYTHTYFPLSRSLLLARFSLAHFSLAHFSLAHFSLAHFSLAHFVSLARSLARSLSLSPPSNFFLYFSLSLSSKLRWLRLQWALCNGTESLNEDKTERGQGEEWGGEDGGHFRQLRITGKQR